MPSVKHKFDDIQVVTERHVHCDGTHNLGEQGDQGHPLVYLCIPDEADRIVCPYCSRLFLYEGKGK